MMQNNRVGHCQTGASDKVYIVNILEHEGNFIVKALWGRRGKISQSQIKGSFATIGSARIEMEKIFASKLKGGYVNIESTDYNGLVTLDSVYEHLTPDVEFDEFDEFDDDSDLDEEEIEPSTAPRPKVDSIFDDEELEAICMDNLGMEENFLIGVNYLAEEHNDSDMIYVFDRFGEKKECYKERFKIVK